MAFSAVSFSALTLLVGWWGVGVVICLERGADLHMAQLMPLPLTVSCFSKIQIGFTFLVRAYPGSPGKIAVKWVFVIGGYHNFVHVILQPPVSAATSSVKVRQDFVNFS